MRDHNCYYFEWCFLTALFSFLHCLRPWLNTGPATALPPIDNTEHSISGAPFPFSPFAVIVLFFVRFHSWGCIFSDSICSPITGLPTLLRLRGGYYCWQQYHATPGAGPLGRRGFQGGRSSLAQEASSGCDKEMKADLREDFADVFGYQCMCCACVGEQGCHRAPQHPRDKVRMPCLGLKQNLGDVVWLGGGGGGWGEDLVYFSFQKVHLQSVKLKYNSFFIKCVYIFINSS